ncbi:MAG TPA: branched-chain amino acid ABC transporter permease [Gaiellaceae bacterium]|nr:branched-chain amino acid ABC transporter permease [Gaiellaceae bacterium]
MSLAMVRAKERWREQPQRVRVAGLVGFEVAIAIALLLWVRELGWGFAWFAGLLWTLRIREERFRWGVEAAMTIPALVVLPALGIITAAIYLVAELPRPIRRRVTPVVALGAALAYPFYVSHLFTIPIFGAFPDVATGVVMIVFVMMAVGLNIVVGYAGLLDLGYVAFYATGAYTAAWFASLQFPHQHLHFGAIGITPDLPGIHLSIWLILPIAAIFTGCAGIIIGLPTLRLRGDYLAIVTLGFGEILPQIARNGDNLFGTGFNLTNGPNGITPLDAPGFGNTLHKAIPFLPANYLNSTNSDRLFFWTAIALLLITVFCSWRMRDSRLGRAWIAIREDEIAAAAMGIPLMRTKTWAYAMGAFFGGIAGAYYAVFKSATFPGDFFFNISVFILCMVILGGMGNIWGVIVGAGFLAYLNQEGLANTGAWLSTNLHVSIDVPLYASGIYGVIILLVMLFRPEGLIPDRRHVVELHEGVEDEPLYQAETA